MLSRNALNRLHRSLVACYRVAKIGRRISTIISVHRFLFLPSEWTDRISDSWINSRRSRTRTTPRPLPWTRNRIILLPSQFPSNRFIPARRSTSRPPTSPARTPAQRETEQRTISAGNHVKLSSSPVQTLVWDRPRRLDDAFVHSDGDSAGDFEQERRILKFDCHFRHARRALLLHNHGRRLLAPGRRCVDMVRLLRQSGAGENSFSSVAILEMSRN